MIGIAFGLRARTAIEVVKWKGRGPRKPYMQKNFAGRMRGQGALCKRQEVAMNKSSVIAHIKARSKVLITSGTLKKPANPNLT